MEALRPRHGPGGWLRSLGFERYEAAFRENEITEKVLAEKCPNSDQARLLAMYLATVADPAASPLLNIAMRRLRAQATAQWRKRADDHDHTHRD
jgi:hypothetical protein